MVSQSPFQQRTRNRKPRGRGLRTNTGCTTCRKRHIKCDEGKPECDACMKVNETCVYVQPGRRSLTVSDSTVCDGSHELPAGQHWTTPVNSLSGPISASPTPSLNGQQTHSLEVLHSWNPSRNNNSSHRNPYPSLGNLAVILSPAGDHDLLATSPQNLSDAGTHASGPTGSNAAARWFGLLASDAAREVIQFAESDYGHDWSFLVADSAQDQLSPLQQAARIVDHNQPEDTLPHERSSSARQVNNQAKDGKPSSEEHLWQAQGNIQLLPREHFLFENFLQRISQWIDLFDPMNKFSTLVPHLALRNAGLMNAILALSCRHLSLNPGISIDEPPDRNSALQYYYQTLHYVQKAMRYSSYQTSLELLATTLIISTYEMLDGSCKDWERHLEGVFWIQRSQVIHGESEGLKSAVWWAWLCQDVWAAFREKRKTFTFWTPQKPYTGLSPCELASRSVWIMAQVVNYCSREESVSSDGNYTRRIDRAAQLRGLLDEWYRHLTVEFSPLPTMSRSSSTVFQPIWVHPSSFGVALQLHFASQILLCLHEPCFGGLDTHLKRMTKIQHCVNMICGVAMTLTDDASGLMSAQALFIAGMYIQDRQARICVLELINLCRQRTGWPATPLGDELKELWRTSDPSSILIQEPPFRIISSKK